MSRLSPQDSHNRSVSTYTVVAPTEPARHGSLAAAPASDPQSTRRSPLLRCRSCGSEHTSLVLDLGRQPLANALISSERLGKEEQRFPLDLCLCESCRMLQISEVISPERLFSNYLYFSSCSETIMDHARTAAAEYTASFGLDSDSMVIEVASNDGYLLKNFVEQQIPCLGIEPATNIADAAVKSGIPTLNRFFSTELARELATEGRQADLILGNNVLGHVPDINDFVSAIAILLKPRGRAIFEFPYALDLIDNCQFDTIYHEHVYYYTLTSILPLFQRNGLAVYHAERIPIHGGSLRIYAGPEGAVEKTDRYFQLLGIESLRGVSGQALYAAFANRVRQVSEDLLKFLYALKALGKDIAAYGASAKGTVLLNYLGIGPETLKFVVDRNVHKQGLITPGSHLPILPPEALQLHRPEFTLLLTWNFLEEILDQQASYRRIGGRFIVPLPKLRIL